MTGPARDRVCMERIRAGETQALEELYDRHNDLLYSLVRRIVSRGAEVEDVVQETWLQAWRTAGAYDPARGSVCGWLIAMARSRAIDRLRSEGSRQRAAEAAGLEPPDHPADPSDDAARHERSERMGAALAQLESHHREVLTLAYFAGLSQTEIADRMETPLGTVKSWTRQALSRLTELVPREEWL
jgi:RNA polymerase sigma-70 factor, ECF subfamily